MNSSKETQDRHIRLAKGMGRREISWLEGCTMMQIPPNTYWIGIDGDVRISAPDAPGGFVVFNPDACADCRDRLLFYCLHRWWFISYGRGHDGEFYCQITASFGRIHKEARTPMEAFLRAVDETFLAEQEWKEKHVQSRTT